jgi:TolA-binding protein
LNEKKDQIVTLQTNNEANAYRLQSLQQELEQAKQRIQELSNTLTAQDNYSNQEKTQKG